MKKPLLLFDLDNTLINADKTHVLSFNNAFKKYKLKTVSKRKLKKLFGMPKEQIVRTVHPHIEESLIKKIVKYKELEVKKTAKYAKPFKGVKDTLLYLKQFYKLGLITNCSRTSMKALIKATKLNFFDICISTDDVKHPKPAPDELLKAQRVLKTKALYHVGDSVYDVRAAKKAKVNSIAVLSGHYSKRILKKEHPSLMIKNVNKLRKIL